MKSEAYKVEYMRYFEASEPFEEWDSRNRLYSVKTQLMYSAHIFETKVRVGRVKFNFRTWLKAYILQGA